MSTIILSSIFGQAGSIFGPIGRIIGSELGALLGAQLDGAMFGLDAEQKVTHGARLKICKFKPQPTAERFQLSMALLVLQGTLFGHSQ